jgi:hypothetical protein
MYQTPNSGRRCSPPLRVRKLGSQQTFDVIEQELRRYNAHAAKPMHLTGLHDLERAVFPGAADFRICRAQITVSTRSFTAPSGFLTIALAEAIAIMAVGLLVGVGATLLHTVKARKSGLQAK